MNTDLPLEKPPELVESAIDWPRLIRAVQEHPAVGEVLLAAKRERLAARDIAHTKGVVKGGGQDIFSP